ncbi:MAG: peptide deformylase [Flavobacteriales bacterium]|nr:peptide deformylase [Flavobacteriales bacterium]MCB9195462.1 peptide deformylase [Flavobacteriales bacterium]MCB9198366.1 peptide deformylase [Flavobacteriales bacterium]
MVLPIYAYGSPVLREETEEIEEGTDISKLLEDMFETMYDSQGVGLAAPQIGKALRLFIVDASPFAEDEPENEEEAKNLEILKNFKKVFINPIIEEEEGKEWAFSEGCLSIPNIREDVTRKSVVTISYFDENWEFHEEKFAGIAARIIQHEYDHIEGVLFTDYLNPLKKRLLKRKLEDISKGKVKVGYRMNFPVK